MKNKMLALGASVLLLSGIALSFSASHGACCEKQGVTQTSAASCDNSGDCPLPCCSGGGACCGK